MVQVVPAAERESMLVQADFVVSACFEVYHFSQGFFNFSGFL
jgi:hypothetical protein